MYSYLNVQFENLTFLLKKKKKMYLYQFLYQYFETKFLEVLPITLKHWIFKKLICLCIKKEEIKERMSE